MLARAYQDFTTSDAVTEKVFKVFQDAQGQQHVLVSKLRDSLAERRAA
jgi:nitrogenase-stabilizing/protective protein